MIPITAITGFSTIDSEAVTIVITGVLIVFLSLLLIYLFFRYVLPLFLRLSARINARKTGIGAGTEHGEISGDVNAAIALALYLYMNEIHDEESNVITIRRVSRTYSPWSSKIYSMRNLR